MTADPFAAAEADALALTAHLGGVEHDVAVVLGTAWDGVADGIGVADHEIEAHELAGFPEPTVHAGRIRSVAVGGHRVVVLVGRVHLYEGFGATTVAHGVRTAVLAGARTVVLTNGAGSLRPEWEPGTPVLIADHVNLTGRSPLTGPPPPEHHPGRHVDLIGAYDPELRELARSVDPTLAEGVYAGLAGPHFETPAEIAVLAGAGADLVGMSTVLETIAARHLGARVLGLSLVTNLAAGLVDRLDADHIAGAGDSAAARLGPLLRTVLERIPPATG